MRALLSEVCSEGGFCGDKKWNSIQDFDAHTKISGTIFAENILKLEGMNPEYYSNHVKYLQNSFERWFGEGQTISISEIQK